MNINASHSTLFKWLSTQHDKMIEQLIEWSSINSGSYNLDGLAKMADVIIQSASGLNAQVERISLPSFHELTDLGHPIEKHTGEALVFTKRPNAPIQILLCGHRDTVFELDHPFQKPKRVSENEINGPGVTDMKGGLLVSLYALLALEQYEHADQIGWQWLITPDEEIGSFASNNLLRATAKNHDLGFIFEPSMTPEGTLAGARKGSGHISFIAHGKAAHAGREPEKGRNAINALSSFLHELAQLNDLPNGLVMNVGKIAGGGPLNVVPDRACAHLNIRVGKTEDYQWLEKRLEQMLISFNRQDGIHIEMESQFSRPAKPMEGKTKALFDWVVAAGQEISLNLPIAPSGGVCDGNNLTAAGLPVVDTLGVRGNYIHTENEYILLDSLVERAQLTTLLLLKLADGHGPWEINKDDDRQTDQVK